MSIQLPAWLTQAAAWVGLTWPEADEDKLTGAGHAWLTYSLTLSGQAQQVATAAGAVAGGNSGEAIDAFRQWIDSSDGPKTHLTDASTAAGLIGNSLLIMAGIVVALKLAFIAQLAALAIAVGQAVMTAGTTGTVVPAVIAMARAAIRALISKAVQQIQTQVAQLLKRAIDLLRAVKKFLTNPPNRIGRLYFGKGGPKWTPPRQQPNAVLRDLEKYELPDVWVPGQDKPSWLTPLSASKRSDLGELSDNQLRDSVLQPADGSFIRATDDGVVLNGNHRVWEMRRRAGMLDGVPAPSGSTITPSEPIYVEWVNR
jgi:hypothetical protein